jgi:PAS domain S-box-containing protein
MGMAIWAAPQARLIVLVVLIPIFALAGLIKPMPHPGGGIQDSGSTLIAIAALLWTPPEVALGVGIGSCVGGRLFRRTEWWRTDSNAASWGIASAIAAMLALLVLYKFPQGALGIVTRTSVAVFANFVANRLIFAVTRGYVFQRPFLRELRQGLSFGWPHELLDLPVIAVIVAMAYGIHDLAWSLAMTTAAMLLLPLSQWVDRRYLELIMKRRASETQLVALMQHFPDGISLVNAEGTIVYANPAASRVLGYGKAEHVGRSWFEICHPEDVDRVKSLFSSLVRDPGSNCTIEARMLHKDGSWKWIHASQINLFMEPGVRAIVVTYRDITQGRRSEENLEEYAARLEDLSRRLVQAQETERRRIAQELHDETGQILTGLKLTLDVALRQIGAKEGCATLSRVAAMLETLQKQLRTVSVNLRPVVLDDLGLLPAILMLCNQYERDMSLRVRIVHDSISGRRFAPEVESTAYRIVQEGLTNIARHAGVNEATVTLWTNEEVLGIQMEDCGRGFVVESAESVARSSGLSGMRERVFLLGGEFTIDSSLGAGTRLTAELPLGKPAIVALAAKG